jgi:hypothetical protein
MLVKMKMSMLAMFNFTNARKVTGSADQHVQNPHRLKIKECGNNVLKKSSTFEKSAKTKLSIRGSNSLAPTQSTWSKVKQLQNPQVKGQRMQCPRLKSLSTRKIHRFRDQHRHNPQAQKFST